MRAGLDVNEIADRLNDLETAPNVARFLLQRGIRGWTGDPFCCPVATYLQHTTTAADICVSSSLVTTDDDSYMVEVPPRVSCFIQDFDDLVYPELIGDYVA